MELRVVNYDEKTGLVSFIEEEKYCVDTDCSVTNIMFYYKYKYELDDREKEALEKYLEGDGK